MFKTFVGFKKCQENFEQRFKKDILRIIMESFNKIYQNFDWSVRKSCKA